MEHEAGKVSLPPSEDILALARTCRQAYNEVTAIYYGENAFYFPNFWDMKIFMYMIGAHNRQCMKDVRVQWSEIGRGSANNAAALLGECKKMRHFEIVLGPESALGARGQLKFDLFQNPRTCVLGLIRGMKNVQVEVTWKRTLYHVPSLYSSSWSYRKDHRENFAKWLQEKMRIQEKSELVFVEETGTPKEREDENFKGGGPRSWGRWFSDMIVL
ncbi:hypothetical protein HYALB_00010905 [Hymenoscyphus albidus]|uniref:DUF7730 domain-containing protein n=1 Tax=Hymenoscyphus albidus TaxID=595503 RepID=A0A9N9LHB5_9HELO|nr:hypothetical protein HYALB_00010905 [Hymenoscyphus albidus]